MEKLLEIHQLDWAHEKEILRGNFRAYCQEILRSIFSNADHGKTVDTALNCPNLWIRCLLKRNRQDFRDGCKVTINNPERMRVWDGFEIQRYRKRFSYYYFWANQWKANIKIFSWTQYEINKDRRDWHILAGNDERIISHNLNRCLWVVGAYVSEVKGGASRVVEYGGEG